MERNLNRKTEEESTIGVLQEIGDISISDKGFSVFDGRRSVFFRMPEIPESVRNIPKLVREIASGKRTFVPRFCGDRIIADFGKKFREIRLFKKPRNENN